VLHPPYLRKTLLTALVVGTILFAINHLDELLTGKATPAMWIKSGVTFLVPFIVSNVGLLVGSRRRPENSGTAAGDRENFVGAHPLASAAQEKTWH
jgi:hypothetical protein